MSIILQCKFIARLIISMLCGLAIGYERENRSKEAGLRTHCIVASAAALMMILSKYGFWDLIDYPGSKGADPSRIASQIITGVGFLGAGMIFVQGQTIKGLTTAAGMWATAGIGMTIGCGMFVVGIAATVILLITQIILHNDIAWLNVKKVKSLCVYNVEYEGFQNHVRTLLMEHGIKLMSTYVTKNVENKTKDYEFLIEIPRNIHSDEIISLFDYSCALKSGM